MKLPGIPEGWNPEMSGMLSGLKKKKCPLISVDTLPSKFKREKKKADKKKFWQIGLSKKKEENPDFRSQGLWSAKYVQNC